MPRGRTPAVRAEITAAKAKRTAAQGQLPQIDIYNGQGNLSGPEQTAMLRQIGLAVERITRGVIGG